MGNIYFRRMYQTLVRFGNLNNKTILDFGCGNQGLADFLNHARYYAYDKDQKKSNELSWKGLPIDSVVINEVFYEMTPDEIITTLAGLKSEYPVADIIVGISRRGLINKLGAFFLERSAFDKTVTPPKIERELVKNYPIKSHTSMFFMYDIYKI